MSYDKSSHTVFHHRYHIVWITKYRFKVLRGALRERVREIVRQVCREMGATIISGVHVERSRPPVRVDPAEHLGEPVHAAREGTLVAQDPAGVPRHPQALLGPPLLGQGLFLHHQRCRH